VSLPTLRVLWIDDPKAISGDTHALEMSAYDVIRVQRCTGVEGTEERLATGRPDLVVLCLPSGRGDGELSQAPWPQLMARLPLLLVTPETDPRFVAKWIAAGVQDILTPEEASGEAFARRVSAARVRKARENEARKSWSTDLNTGLAHRNQLQEHLSQLVALRARQPAPMAVLAIRIEGFEQLERQQGDLTAQLVRRKIAVRLRSAVRASDVVASLAPDLYAVLLTWLEAPNDAEAVALKLGHAVRQPFNVSGQSASVRAFVGMARFPNDSQSAEELLGMALSQAELASRQVAAAANDA
jgi:diguanylate cyclase (GGDEF)-like protein